MCALSPRWRIENVFFDVRTAIALGAGSVFVIFAMTHCKSAVFRWFSRDVSSRTCGLCSTRANTGGLCRDDATNETKLTAVGVARSSRVERHQPPPPPPPQMSTLPPPLPGFFFRMSGKPCITCNLSSWFCWNTNGIFTLIWCYWWQDYELVTDNCGNKLF